MEKVTKSLEEVLRVKKALDQLLTFPGIPYKKVYWFGRNRDEIFKVAKVFDKERDGIFMRFATILDIPYHGIPKLDLILSPCSNKKL